MTANQLLTALDRASISAPSADARRILNSEASSLRVALEFSERKAKLLRSAERPGETLENARMYRRLAADLGSPDVAAAMQEAQRVLNMWRHL